MFETTRENFSLDVKSDHFVVLRKLTVHGYIYSALSLDTTDNPLVEYVFVVPERHILLSAFTIARAEPFKKYLIHSEVFQNSYARPLWTHMQPVLDDVRGQLLCQTFLTSEGDFNVISFENPAAFITSGSLYKRQNAPSELELPSNVSELMLHYIPSTIPENGHIAVPDELANSFLYTSMLEGKSQFRRLFVGPYCDSLIIRYNELYDRFCDSLEVKGAHIPILDWPESGTVIGNRFQSNDQTFVSTPILTWNMLMVCTTVLSTISDTASPWINRQMEFSSEQGSGKSTALMFTVGCLRGRPGDVVSIYMPDSEYWVLQGNIHFLRCLAEAISGSGAVGYLGDLVGVNSAQEIALVLDKIVTYLHRVEQKKVVFIIDQVNIFSRSWESEQDRNLRAPHFLEVLALYDSIRKLKRKYEKLWIFTSASSNNIHRVNPYAKHAAIVLAERDATVLHVELKSAMSQGELSVLYKKKEVDASLMLTSGEAETRFLKPGTKLSVDDAVRLYFRTPLWAVKFLETVKMHAEQSFFLISHTMKTLQ